MQNMKFNEYNSSLFNSIEAELKQVQEYLALELPSISGPLSEMVKFVMGNKGKLLRPALAILSAHLTGGTIKAHFILAELTELIHTASLVHDDLLDEASTRRGQETSHLKWGSKISVIIGDFLFAQASVKLGELNNTQIVKIYAQVLADLCTGEVAQAQNRFNLASLNWEAYLNKSIFKTASLFAAATQSAALINQKDKASINNLFAYGQNLGIAFQIIDDLLDFTSSPQELGKPALGDLSQGVFTAPVLFALENDQVKNKLKILIQTRFANQVDLLEAHNLIAESKAFQKTINLAESYIAKALKSIEHFSESVYKQDLQTLAKFVLARHN